MIPTEIYKFLAFTISKISAVNFSNVLREVLDKKEKNWKFFEMPLDLNLVCEPPAPPFGGAHFPKFVIWEPLAGDGSVFFSNRMDGWPMLVRGISRLFSEPFIDLRISNDYETYPVCSMSYWVNGENKRCVQVLLDDKWEFFQKGQMLAFEDPKYYINRRIRDRLTKKILIEYLETLGWNISDVNFWDTNTAAFYGNQLSWGRNSGSDNL